MNEGGNNHYFSALERAAKLLCLLRMVLLLAIAVAATLCQQPAAAFLPGPSAALASARDRMGGVMRAAKGFGKEPARIPHPLPKPFDAGTLGAEQDEEDEEMRLKNDGQWKGVMWKSSFEGDASKSFEMPPFFGMASKPLEYTLTQEKLSPNVYRVATKWDVPGMAIDEYELLLDSKNIDVDEDGSYTVEHGSNFVLQGERQDVTIEHSVSITSSLRNRLFMRYDRTGQLVSVLNCEETRQICSPEDQEIVEADRAQGIGAAHEFNVDESIVQRCPVSLSVLGTIMRGSWAGWGRMRSYRSELSTQFSLPFKVELEFDALGQSFFQRRARVWAHKPGSGGGNGNPAGADVEKEDKGDWVTLAGRLDPANLDALWVDQDSSLLMALPGGCFVLCPVHISSVAPFQTEFGYFFQTDSAKYLSRSVRVHKEGGAVSNCSQTFLTYRQEDEEHVAP
jgi:hypothetical protein